MTISPTEVQTYLKVRGFYNGNIDGIFGRQSAAASLLCIINAAKAGGFKIDDALKSSPERHRLGVEQIMMAEQGFYLSEIDGLMGPDTRYGYTKWDAHNWRDPIMEQPVDTPPPVVTDTIPFQRDMEKVYGRQGANQVRLTVPYPLKIAWNLAQTVNSFYLHEKVADSAERVLKRVLDHYGLEQIIVLGLDIFAGCLANPPRPMRGGSSPSTHNWGIAIDWDSEHNQLRWDHNRAKFAKPEYGKFWQLWEEEGWLSLGRARDFDWMHVQRAKL